MLEARYLLEFLSATSRASWPFARDDCSAQGVCCPGFFFWPLRRPTRRPLQRRSPSHWRRSRDRTVRQV